MKIARRMAQKRFRSKRLRFLVDECASSWAVLKGLRAVGHDIVTANDISGSADSDLLSLAALSERILITLDSDFGKLVFVDHLPTYGVVYLRGFAQNRGMLMPHLVNQIAILNWDLVGKFTHIEVDKTGKSVQVKQINLTFPESLDTMTLNGCVGQLAVPLTVDQPLSGIGGSSPSAPTMPV